MATARAVYTDLVIINFTLSGTSFPTSTQVPKVITALYINAYGVLNETYAAYDASAEHEIIDTAACKQLIIEESEEIVQAWNLSGKDNPPPSNALSRKAEKKIKSWMSRKLPLIANVRVYGSDYDDMGVI